MFQRGGTRLTQSLTRSVRASSSENHIHGGYKASTFDTSYVQAEAMLVQSPTEPVLWRNSIPRRLMVSITPGTRVGDEKHRDQGSQYLHLTRRSLSMTRAHAL